MSGILDIYCILLYTCSMAATPSTMLPLGTAAPNFALPNVVTGQTISLETFADKKALLVMFLCRHCKYVQHVKRELATLGRDYQGKDIGIVAISANDAAAYADDAPESLKDMAAAESFTFPLCYDETQAVAKAYTAACTPDFFLFDRQRKLVYRGQLDDSRPGNQMPVTGKDVRAAIEAVLADQPINPVQKPSIGCNIKWKEGNEPSYFLSQ
jgi:peroxiredoxin